MLEKLISLIFCSEIPHGDLINVVYLFCSDLLLFSKNIGKIVHVTNCYKMVDIKGPSINTRTSLLKSAEASSLFFLSCSYMGGICKFFKPKTRSFYPNLNSQRVFKNRRYFMGSKSNFGQSGIVIRFDNHVTSQRGGHSKIREFSYSLRFARHLFDYTRVIYP